MQSEYTNKSTQIQDHILRRFAGMEVGLDQLSGMEAGRIQPFSAMECLAEIIDSDSPQIHVNVHIREISDTCLFPIRNTL